METSRFLSVSEGKVSSRRILGPKASGPNAQTDLADNMSFIIYDLN